MRAQAFAPRMRGAARDRSAPVALQRSCACTENGSSCPRCGSGNRSLQRFAATSGLVPAAAIPAAVGDVLRSPGAPLPASIRSGMEMSFDHDFSAVRIHADAQAQRSAEAVAARAYTVGSDVVFGEGGPDLESADGHRLLGHELAHVVQQSRGGVAAGVDSSPDLENEARQEGDRAGAGRPAAVSGAAAPTLAREPKATAKGSDLAEYNRAMEENDEEIFKGNYADATWNRVSETVDLDGVPIAGRAGVYDASGVYTSRNTEMDEIVGRYRDLQAAQGAGDPPLVGNEVIIMHDLATEAEKSRRSGLSPDIQDFKEFNRRYAKEHGTTEGVEQAFFAYHDAKSAKLFEGYRKIDAAAHVVNWIAGSTVGLIASGFNPVAVFGPMAIGKGVQVGAEAAGVDKEIANGLGDLGEMASGFAVPSLAHGPPGGTAARAEQTAAGTATRDAEQEALAVARRDAKVAGGAGAHPNEASLRPAAETTVPGARAGGEPVATPARARKPVGDPAPKAPASHVDAGHKPLTEPEPIGGGHHTQVTPEGIELCSGSPCPNLRVVYKKQLAASAEMQREMNRLDAMRRVAAMQEQAGKLDSAFVQRISKDAAKLQTKLEQASLGNAVNKVKPPTAATAPPAPAGPQTGPYRDVAGHHVHQSASMSPRGTVSASGNPNHCVAISIEQGVPGFSGAQHEQASAAQRNINRAMHGEAHEAQVGGVNIGSSGDGQLVLGSLDFEDVKAYYALRAAGRSSEAALDLVMRSRAQIEAAGTGIVRVPTR